jgi:hypothetical protein
MRERAKPRHPIRYWMGQLFALPVAALEYAAGKWAAVSASIRLAEEAAPLRLSASAMARLKLDWERLLPAGAAAEGKTGAPAAGWTEAERALIERIREETAALNRNNVTRTEAYRAIYFRLPELHWALLAHMVSRNGGWNMTDLRGEWLPRLLTEEQRTSVFQFLEQANAAIFHDAYPQLKLYEWSVREGKSLFHLLPAFDVSLFMEPVWRLFWRERDPVPLTVALIVNEQHYIEQRVVKQPYMLEHVLHTLFFGLQSLLQLNGVVFPYGRGNVSGRWGAETEPRLVGLVLERFEDIHERIELGKRLYALLFGLPAVYNGVRRFACAVPHTGSRADYAPHLFARSRTMEQQPLYEERLQGRTLKQGAPLLYSPELESAWADQPVAQLASADWFQGLSAVERYFRQLPVPRLFEMTEEHMRMLNKLELAVLAAQEGK